MTTEPGAALTEAIDEFFHMVRRGVDTSAMDTLVRMDLTLTQLRVIMVLKDADDPRPIYEIAELLGLSMATAGRAVDHLVQHGLAERWEDPDDRRSKLVRLSKDGRELTEVQRHAVATQVRAFADSLPSDVADRLSSAIRAALAAVASGPDGSTPSASSRPAGADTYCLGGAQ